MRHVLSCIDALIPLACEIRNAMETKVMIMIIIYLCRLSEQESPRECEIESGMEMLASVKEKKTFTLRPAKWLDQR